MSWLGRLLRSRPPGDPDRVVAPQKAAAGVGISRRGFLRGAATAAIVVPSTRTIVDLAANTYHRGSVDLPVFLEEEPPGLIGWLPE